MTGADLPFREVWAADFEFSAPDGERPAPVCMVAKELRSGRLVRLWRDDFRGMPTPPFDSGSDSLFVAYYASAELGCFLALGWAMPARILDLCAEFRCHTSGLEVPCGRGLLGAMTYYGLGGIEAAEKESLRQLAMRGGEYTGDEQRALLDYCQSDVDALEKLLPAMLPELDLPRALIRGRYMAAAARIEWEGVPIDVETLARLRAGWGVIQDRLIVAVDADYGVFDGRTFKADRWAGYLERNGIPWPRLESGALDLSRDAFHEMARAYPAIAPIGELRHALSGLRLNDLAVGSDGRNRCLLSAFASKTGRNQPSNSRFIFGPAVWLRCLIKPATGRAVAYVDYEQHEFGISAALSGDALMMRAYSTGDPYLDFARLVRAVPAGATRHTHKAERERFKVLALAVQYGMGPDSLARRLGESPARARELMWLHRQTYRQYWQWSDSIQDRAMLTGKLQATFGWCVHVGRNANPRSLRNFPLQANGAEMLRIACCLTTEWGIRVCAPVHDALLIEASVGEIESAVAECQAAMREASEIVLAGFPLRTEAKIVCDPERYVDPRGERMWRTVLSLLAEQPGGITSDTLRVSPMTPPPSLISSMYGVPPDGLSDKLPCAPGPSAVAPVNAGGDPPEDKTPTPPPRGDVLEGADSVGLAGASSATAGASAACGADTMAASRDDTSAHRAILPELGQDAGAEQTGNPPGAAESGISELGVNCTATGPGGGSDPFGFDLTGPPATVPPELRVLLVTVGDADARADLLLVFHERAGICEYDGNLDRATAELVAQDGVRTALSAIP